MKVCDVMQLSLPTVLSLGCQMPEAYEKLALLMLFIGRMRNLLPALPPIKLRSEDR